MAKKTLTGAVDLSNPKKPAIKLENKALMEDALVFLGDGTRIRITIERFYPERSLNQNGLLHWWLDLLAEEAGMEMKDFKQMMGLKYLQKPKMNKDGSDYLYDRDTGEVIMYIESTSALNTTEFGEFLEKVRLFGLDVLNYELPQPDKNYKLHFTQKLKDHQI